MSKVSDVYGGQYLKAVMIGDETYRLEIKSVEEELVGQDQERKLVVYFKSTDKGLILNATNANTLAESYGDDTDRWAGKTIDLYTIWTEYAGRRIKGVRVSTESSGLAAPPLMEPDEPDDEPGDWQPEDDSLPF